MKPMKHDKCEGKCEAWNHKQWLCHIAPDILWYNIQSVGSYQGQVFGVGRYKAKILLYEDYYGSCSG